MKINIETEYLGVFQNAETLEEILKIKTLMEEEGEIFQLLYSNDRINFKKYSSGNNMFSIVEFLKNSGLDVLGIKRDIPRVMSISSSEIKAIVSKEELKALSTHESYDVSNLVLISIQDPSDEDDLGVFRDKFKSAISERFWDVEEDLKVKSNGYDVVPLNSTNAKNIALFIKENINEQFFIHCAAGVSRSAGIGLAVECITKFNADRYDYSISNSEIKDHFRYSPNYVVYNKIMDEYWKL